MHVAAIVADIRRCSSIVEQRVWLFELLQRNLESDGLTCVL